MQTTSQAAAVGQISLLAQHTNEFGCRALRTCYRHRIRIRLRGEIGTRLIVNHFLAHSHSSPARSVSNPRDRLVHERGNVRQLWPASAGSLPSFATPPPPPSRPRMEPKMRYGDRDDGRARRRGGRGRAPPARPARPSQRTMIRPAARSLALSQTNNARG